MNILFAYYHGAIEIPIVILFRQTQTLAQCEANEYVLGLFCTIVQYSMCRKVHVHVQYTDITEKYMAKVSVEMILKNVTVEKLGGHLANAHPPATLIQG